MWRPPLLHRGQRSELMRVLVAVAWLAAAVAATAGGVANAKEWAVHLYDDAAADDLAGAHSLVNLGEILPGSKIYHLAAKEEHSRAKRDLIHTSLEGHPSVKWLERQNVLSRSKRMPVECYISTLPTDNKISRRCVFPFIYKGKKYNSCTADHSSNGKPWCATEVRGDGQVISGKWGDCDFGSCNGEGPQQVPQALPPRPQQPPPRLEDLKTQWNDPKWPEMWFLNRGYHNGTGFALDMNVEEAWEMGASGKGVVVTILDDGVEKFHPDLMANYDEEASIDLNDNDRDPSPRYDLVNSNKHGTRCAGQVSALANNSECSVGIAYNSRIGGVRVLDGPITDALEAKALSFHRDHIDIYSASWGPDDDGNTVDGPGTLASRALEDGVRLGRGGKGSIFLWASGNGGKFADNCNADGYTTSPFTLSVSSASENGKIPWYSEPCSSSIASTFSSGSKQFNERKITTTDLYGKCTNSHTGTSASSPIAAGIVALALEVNPELTWRDIQHLTVRTSRPRGMLEARDWSDNGVGLSFSHSFGFGLMDAGAMVKLAKEWKTVPEQEICAIKGAPKQSYGIRGGVQRSFIVTVDEGHPCADQIGHLEHLHVYVDIQSRNVRRGNLMVVVESPQGTTSTLLGFRPADQIYGGFGLFNKWPMMSVHFWGENPVGNWTLTVVNRSPDPEDNAELFDWTLKFYGTKEDPQPGVGVLDHRQVDQTGRKIQPAAVSTVEDAPKPQPEAEDLSEARGLEALEAHTKLTKEALDLIDDITEDDSSIKEEEEEPEESEESEVAEEEERRTDGSAPVSESSTEQSLEKEETFPEVYEETSVEEDTTAEESSSDEDETEETTTELSEDDVSATTPSSITSLSEAEEVNSSEE